MMLRKGVVVESSLWVRLEKISAFITILHAHRSRKQFRFRYLIFLNYSLKNIVLIITNIIKLHEYI